MATYQTLTNSILDEMSRTDLTAAVASEINLAISFYQRRRFSFLETQATAVTVSGQEFMALPLDFGDMDSLTIQVNGAEYVLQEQRYDQLEVWSFTNSTGQPTDFAVYNQQLRLYPVPDDAYTLRMSYVRELPPLAADDDTNAWTTEGERLIRSRVLWVLYASRVKDYDAAQAAKMIESEELDQHERVTSVQLFTGHTRRRC